MQQAEIELLVIDAQLGDEKAFTQLCHYFYKGLIHFAYKISGNEQLAQDAVQNSWLKIAKSFKRIKDPRSFKSWIYQSVRWQTLDLLKKQQKELNKQSTTDVEELIDKTPINGSEENKNLLHHINQLAEIDKQAIHLFYLEEMSLQEISIIIAVPIGTIKSRLNRARKILKQKLEITQES